MYIGQENSVSEPQKVLSLQIVPNCVDGNLPYHRPHSSSGCLMEKTIGILNGNILVNLWKNMENTKQRKC